MDIKWARENISLLDGLIHYFNNASTSLKPDCVMEHIANLCKYHNGDFLGDYQNSDFVTTQIAECRRRVAELINCNDDEVIFTSNCTDSLDRLSQIVGIKENDNVVCSIIDHNANFIPWKKRGANIYLIKTLQNGTLDLKELEDFLKNNKVKIISLPAVSNTAGNIQPFKEVVEIGHRYGVQVCIDFAQYIPHRPVDFKDTDCDFCCFSAHKIGSTCFGVLVGKKDVLEQYREERYVKNLRTFFDENGIPMKPVPSCFEFGSLQFTDIIALSHAIDFLTLVGYDTIKTQEDILKDYFLAKHESYGMTRLLFPVQRENYIPTFTFRFTDESIDIVKMNKILLERFNIVLSCSSQCAQPLYRHYGEEMGLRASFAYYNTKDEIDYFFNKLTLLKSENLKLFQN
jgi:cysteine desulfurase/selenocysteine lyase